MNAFIEKISSYNIFNYLLPGVLFSIIMEHFIPYSLGHENTVLLIFIYYFIGLIISRFGSLVIEPFLKKVAFLNFSDHDGFVSASSGDVKIEILSEANNMYRTLCSMFVLLLFFKGYKGIESFFSISHSFNSYALILMLLLLFLFSYKKQTDYIGKRIK